MPERTFCERQVILGETIMDRTLRVYTAAPEFFNCHLYAYIAIKLLRRNVFVITIVYTVYSFEKKIDNFIAPHTHTHMEISR